MVEGVIIPDMPFDEQGELIEYAKKYEVDIITLIAPTSKERVKMLAKESQGYIYLVSSLGVTGVRKEINTDLSEIIKEIREATNTKIAVGFGISTTTQAKKFSALSDGVIVGSAIVKLIEQHKKNATKYLYEYVSELKRALKGL